VLTVRQHFDYYYYPFDVQELKIKLKIVDTNITNCEMVEGRHYTHGEHPLAGHVLTPDNVQAELLGTASLWTVRDGLHAVRTEHIVEDGQPLVHTCVIIIQIERNFLVYVVKHLAINILIVLGSIITAQSLSADEHTGDRCAVLLLALLILVTSMYAAGIRTEAVGANLVFDSPEPSVGFTRRIP
jgi:hypothetical protein